VVKARLKTGGVEGAYLVRDRAKARSTRAETGLACLHIPEVLPLSQALAQGSALAICGRLRPAQQALAHAGQRLATWQASHPGRDRAQQAQAVGEVREAEGKRWQAVRAAYRPHRAPLALTVPPLASCGLDLPDSPRGCTPVTGRHRGACHVERNHWGAGEAQGRGQGPQATHRRVGPG
jgi:hypothetical protein